MEPVPDVTERVLALLTTLQTGRAFGGDELAARLGVSPRTLRRDVDRLRGYGYPVETRPGPGGHYRLAAGATLPPLVFDDDEAIATLLALAVLAAGSAIEGSGAAGGSAAGNVDEAALRAYGKIDQYLPKRLRHRAVRLRASVETGSVPVPGVRAEDLARLGDAIQHRHPVVFDYADEAGSRSTRRVEPYRQIHHLLRWYLLGWDVDRAGWRTFRIDRLTDLRTATATFAPRPLPADGAVEFLRRGIDRHHTRVELTVHAPLPRVADALVHQVTELTALDDERTAVVLMLEGWPWLVLILAGLDAEVTIDAPAEFRDACAAFGRRLAGGR